MPLRRVSANATSSSATRVSNGNAIELPRTRSPLRRIPRRTAFGSTGSVDVDAAYGRAARRGSNTRCNTGASRRRIQSATADQRVTRVAASARDRRYTRRRRTASPPLATLTYEQLAYPTGLSCTRRPRDAPGETRHRASAAPDTIPRHAGVPQRGSSYISVQFIESMHTTVDFSSVAREPAIAARFAQRLAISQRKTRHACISGTSLATLGPERPRRPLDFWPRRLPDSHAA